MGGNVHAMGPSSCLLTICSYPSYIYLYYYVSWYCSYSSHFFQSFFEYFSKFHNNRDISLTLASLPKVNLHIWEFAGGSLSLQVAKQHLGGLNGHQSVSDANRFSSARLSVANWDIIDVFMFVRPRALPLCCVGRGYNVWTCSSFIQKTWF